MLIFILILIHTFFFFFFYFLTPPLRFFFFFFNCPAPPEIYPLSLPDALPISDRAAPLRARRQGAAAGHARGIRFAAVEAGDRQHDPLRCRRRDRHYSRRRHHDLARPADVDQIGRAHV